MFRVTATIARGAKRGVMSAKRGNKHYFKGNRGAEWVERCPRQISAVAAGQALLSQRKGGRATFTLLRHTLDVQHDTCSARTSHFPTKLFHATPALRAVYILLALPAPRIPCLTGTGCNSTGFHTRKGKTDCLEKMPVLFGCRAYSAMAKRPLP